MLYAVNLKLHITTSSWKQLHEYSNSCVNERFTSRSLWIRSVSVYECSVCVFESLKIRILKILLITYTLCMSLLSILCWTWPVSGLTAQNQNQKLGLTKYSCSSRTTTECENTTQHIHPFLHKFVSTYVLRT